MHVFKSTPGNMRKHFSASQTPELPPTLPSTVHSIARVAGLKQKAHLISTSHDSSWCLG